MPVFNDDAKGFIYELLLHEIYSQSPVTCAADGNGIRNRLEQDEQNIKQLKDAME